MILTGQNTAESALALWLQTENPDKIFAVTDSTTFNLFQRHFTGMIDDSNVVIIPQGEQHKNLTSAEMIWDMLVQEGATRRSLLINFGGGMVTDLGGFAASTYMRGIRFVNIPTSLLAMVDASTGGKTGVNYGHFKNYIGTFTEPAEVFVDPRWLNFLPGEELVNGWAEVVKHAIIQGGTLWQTVKNGIPGTDEIQEWSAILEANIKIKTDIVQRDLRESGIRKVLNLGHTAGHALEAWFLETSQYLPHGQAVAAGICIESHIALQKGMMTKEDFEDISAIISDSFSQIEIQKESINRFIEIMRGDKKNHSGQILMVLPVKPGDVQIDISVSEGEINSAFLAYASN